ncbi:pentraxin-related protein PTX3-like isoform X1 [Latimeria chalumnae]|uniref:pentraxin-related protein PTX3-like isoform X1 n=1 Tax=Latimeria chalumnae TaxID=7897 RepID=UPI00313D360A
MLSFRKAASYVALCILTTLANHVEQEDNFLLYPELYEDVVEEGESHPCPADRARWDKMFVMLEDSQMRQNMLLSSVDDLLAPEVQTLRLDVQCFPQAFHGACNSATQRASEHIADRLNKKLNVLQTSLLQVQERQRKGLSQLTLLMEGMVKQLVAIETAMKTPSPARTPSEVMGLEDLKGDFVGLANRLQQTQADLEGIQNKMADKFLPTGCQMSLAFPMRSKSIYAQVYPTTDTNLTSFTACVWVKPTEVLERTGLFFYSTRENVSEFELALRKNAVVFSMGGQQLQAATSHPSPAGKWAHYCSTWDSDSSNATLWANGKQCGNREGMAWGHAALKGGIFTLGQAGATGRGHFSQSTAFAGKMTGFGVWGRVLTDAEILQLARDDGSCSRFIGDVVGWGISEIRPHGGAILHMQ